MIYLFTAQFGTAKPLISYFHLKKDSAQTRFLVYREETSAICLTVTGNGACATAAAVASVCTAFGVGKDDCLIHIGLCEDAGDTGIFLCHQITEDATGRVFYPDILYRHNVREARLVTVPKLKSVLPGGQAGVFYDMEAAAAYQAGNYFFGANQMSFFILAAKTGEEFPAEHFSVLARLIESFCAAGDAKLAGIFGDERAIQEIADRLSRAMHCSKVMTASVLQHVRYARLMGVDVLAIEEELRREQKLPCPDKRAGKRCFEEWKKRLLAREPANYEKNDVGFRGKPTASKPVMDSFWQPFFSHIYVEKAVQNHPRTEQILAKFSDARVVEIGHYKDVFCRNGQNPALQHRSQKLILASKQGKLLYPGAPVCQSFGNKNFYYVSCVMNCIFDCAYCYLKGMYPSGNIVVFVNLEDVFDEVARLLGQISPGGGTGNAVYLCVSYDTDLLALEHVIGYVKEWLSFARKYPHLMVEIRTKCADTSLFLQEQPAEGVVFAFTMSPQVVIEQFERGTPSLAQRIACACEAQKRGFAVRLCFDPMLYFPGWKRAYGGMLDQVFSKIAAEKVQDVSVGAFRVSQDYLKKMRRSEPYSAVVQFPYQNIGGVYQYPKEISGEMEAFVTARLETYLPRNKIWKDYGDMDG